MMKKRNFKEAGSGWLGRICRKAWFGAGIMACLCGLLGGIEALAAENIQVVELCVVEDEEGIHASCIYQNHGNDSGILQLYLEKMDEDGAFYPLNYVDLAVTGDEAHTAATPPQTADPGRYRAVLLQYFGEGVPVVRFRDSGVYERKDTGNLDIAEAGNTGGGDSFGRTVEEKEPSGWEICEHSLTENIICQATPVQDAVMEESCGKCGQVFGNMEIPNSAYAAFLDEAADRINTALPGGQVTVATDRWVSFDARVLDAIEGRRDVSVLVRYRYQGAEHQVWIPAGSDVAGLADESGFCGFCYLSQRFEEKIDE